jgi:purine catabolism regulator
VNRELVQVVLSGGGLKEIADEVAGLLDAAVAVTDAGGGVLAQAGPDRHRATLREALGPDGRLPLPLDPGAGGDRMAVAIDVAGTDHGGIVVFGDGGMPADLGVLERAATVAALVIAKQQAVAAVENKYRTDFLRDVLAGRGGTDGRIVEHGAGFGWDLDRPLTVVAAEIDPAGGAMGGNGTTAAGGADGRDESTRLAAAWAAVVRRHDPRGAVAGFSHEVVAVIGIQAAEVAALAGEVTSLFADHPGPQRTFSTGVSRTVAVPSSLAEAYDQAGKAVRVGRQVHGGGSFAHFDRLGVFRLLSLIGDPAELHAFVGETLGTLAGEDDPEAADLRRTLQVLLDTNLNVAETARRLHFHYNTLRYRIGKLERLLGPFTSDAHLRLNLSLALHVRRMRGI